VNVPGTQRATFQIAELVEQKQRMVAGAGIVAVADAVLLFAMGIIAALPSPVIERQVGQARNSDRDKDQIEHRMAPPNDLAMPARPSKSFNASIPKQRLS
jgi:hypothetical protein